jgi:feruloyl esterase
LAVYSTPPQFFAASRGNSAIGARILQFNFDVDAPKIFATAPGYPQSSMQWDQTVSTDLRQFKANGGKLILFHGLSDAAFSANDTISWYTALMALDGDSTTDFSRLFLVPGMNHCKGGPATDRFDMLSPLVNWVENGVPPDSVLAAASTPSYFNAAARSRPLCPYPKMSHYSGSGDVDAAASFTCQ